MNEGQGSSPGLERFSGWPPVYDRQQEGVGDYFFDSVFADIDSLALYGGIHRIIFGFHRNPATRFPFAIYYRVIGGEAVVFRVLDCRRDPEKIRKAL